MKAQFLFRLAVLQILCAGLHAAAVAQPGGCTLKDPAVHLDFGRSNTVSDFNQVSLSNYDRISGSCPTDGHYTYTPATYDCFAGDWFTIAEDHTPGDVEGNMLLVNASPAGGVFFGRTIGGLVGGRTYELAMWMINVCRLHICCSSLSPNFSVMVSTRGGKALAAFRIGDLPQRTNAQWRKFAGFFNLPAGENSVVLTLYNNTIGGCGNDFALDDITFRECVPPKPSVAAAPKKVAPPAVAKQQAPKPAVVKTSAKKDPQTTVAQQKVAAKGKETPVQELPAPATRTVEAVPLPPVLRTRATPLVKQIETGPGEIGIDLYDNGQVDGDTVSVYHNNQLIVSRARLSQKPIHFQIKVDAAHPEHELIMVAHNLGSIPPNTSLMIVTVGDNRYQVHISSSEQKNAKVVFSLKE